MFDIARTLMILLGAATLSAQTSTSLMDAVHQDDEVLVDRQLRDRPNVNSANRYGISPLMEACVNGNAAIVRKLLDAGADPNTAQPEGETVLMTAARTGSVDAVKLLLDRGARVNAKESWRGQTALMWAAAEKHPAVVQLLLARGAEVNARSRTFDYTKLAPKQGSVPMNYPRGGFTALLFAAREGDLDSGLALLNAHAAMNLGDPDGTTPLLEAIVNFHFDFAALLLEHGADPNARDSNGRAPLYAAVDMHSLDTSTRPNPILTDKRDSMAVIELLLRHGANPNMQLTAFIAPRGPLDVADYTLGQGATPFLRAAKSADVEVMRLLLDHGANPLLATKEGVTPLMAAAGIGWRDGKSHGAEAAAIQAIAMCLDHGAKVNSATDKGQTALHGASLRGADKIASYLISRGADVNAKDDKGNTALGDIVQSFTAQVPAQGTSTKGFSPSVPATLTCAACAGPGILTATSSVPWIVIASVADDAVRFNVFTNTGTLPRTGMVQAARAGHRATLTITEEGSTLPLLHRQVTYLYQRILGREPDPTEFAQSTASTKGLAGVAADLLAGPLDIARLYSLILGRSPEPSELNSTSTQLVTGAEFLSKFR